MKRYRTMKKHYTIRKRIRKSAFVAISALLLLSLPACGSKEEETTAEVVKETVTTEKATSSVPGTKESYGNFKTVFVPEGMKLVGGSLGGKDDPSTVWIQLKDNEARYYRLSIEDEETCKNSANQTKEVNQGAKEVTINAGGTKWTGAAYRYNDMMDCFQIYGKVGDKFVLVSAGWYSYDDEKTTAILESLGF